MLDHPKPNEAAASAAVDTGLDVTPVPVTVTPTPAPAMVETRFADLGGTPAPVQQATPTTNPMADAAGLEDPDTELDARLAALFVDPEGIGLVA